MIRLRCWVLLLGLLLAVGVWGAPVTVSGQVVDAQGKPLAGAEVWLLRAVRDGGMATTATAGQADADGRFSFPNVELAPKTTGASPDIIMLLAYQEPLALGWTSLRTLTIPALVRCFPPKPVTARVVDQQGNGVLANIALAFGTVLTGGGRDFIYLSDDLSRRFSVTANANGNFIIPWLPPDGTARFSVTALGFGSIRWNIGEEIPTPITLKPAGGLEATFTCPEKPELVRDLKVLLNGDALTLYRTTDTAGRVTVTDLVPGKWFVAGAAPITSEWQVGPQEVEVKAGETTPVQIAFRKAILVTGRVVNGDTKEPVAGVKLHVYTITSPETVTSDKNGMYSFYTTLPGHAQVTIFQVPDDYAIPASAYAEIVATEQGGTVPDLAVSPAVVVTGIVVDTTGKPVAGAEVHYGAIVPVNALVTTDEEGRFTLKGIDRRYEIEVWAQKGEAVSRATEQFDPKAPAPLKLVVEPLAPVRLKVRVLNQDGKPVTNARLSTTWGLAGLGQPSAMGVLEADGYCLSQPSTPLGVYSVLATASGYDGAQTSTWQAVPGETHDFGVLRLTRASGFVAGRVVDQEGKPLANASVINSGDGPKVVKANTDQEGRFRLESLYPGRACLVAQAKGFLCIGLCAEVGTADLTLRLQPLAPVTTLGSPLPVTSHPNREAELAAARELLLQAIALKDERLQGMCVGMLATLDQAAATKLSTEAHGAYDRDIAIALGKHLLATDPDKALGYFDSLSFFGKANGMDPYIHYQVDAVMALAKLDPARARRQFDKTVPLVLTVSENELRFFYLMALGKAMLPVDQAQGESALRQAQKIVETQFGRSGNGAELRRMLASCLARLDPDAALEMIQGLQYEEGRPEYPELGVAATIAETDPAKAEAVVTPLPDTAKTQLLPVAYAMLSKDPERAARLVRSIPDEAAKRCGLAWLALGLRQQAPAQSLLLFEEAIKDLVGDERQLLNWNSLRDSGQYAELALLGAQLGYPLYQELAWRAICAREASNDPRFRQDWWELQRLLPPLALCMPDVAQELAAVGAARLQKSSVASGQIDYAYEQGGAAVLEAWAMSDASTVAARAPSLKLTRGDSYLWAVKLLLAEPSQRMTLIFSRQGNVPGVDELDRMWDM